MIESQYTQAVHKKLPPKVYKWKINDNYAGGVPDAFYRFLDNPNQKPLWVEYKFLKTLPKRGITLIIPQLTPQQLTWLKQAVKSGEKAKVIVGVESEKIQRGASGFILSIDEAEKGITTEEARRRLKSYEQIAKEIEMELTT